MNDKKVTKKNNYLNDDINSNACKIYTHGTYKLPSKGYNSYRS